MANSDIINAAIAKAKSANTTGSTPVAAPTVTPVQSETLKTNSDSGSVSA